jgi:hypothetical protein
MYIHVHFIYGNFHTTIAVLNCDHRDIMALKA